MHHLHNVCMRRIIVGYVTVWSIIEEGRDFEFQGIVVASVPSSETSPYQRIYII